MKSLDNNTGARKKRRMETPPGKAQPEKYTESYRIGPYAARLVVEYARANGLAATMVVRECIVQVLGPGGIGITEKKRLKIRRAIEAAENNLSDAAIDKILSEMPSD